MTVNVEEGNTASSSIKASPTVQNVSTAGTGSSASPAVRSAPIRGTSAGGASLVLKRYDISKYPLYIDLQLSISIC